MRAGFAGDARRAGARNMICRMILVMAATERELEGARNIVGVEPMLCGIGPVEAAARTASALSFLTAPTRTTPGPLRALLHVGIAGARARMMLPAGTAVIGSESMYCDTHSPLIDRVIVPDPRLVTAARRALPSARVAPIGTSANVGGTRACDIEGMEGFAVLRAAQLARVPAIEVRVISNDIEEPDRNNWHFDVALDELAVLIPRIVTELRHDLHGTHS